MTQPDRAGTGKTLPDMNAIAPATTRPPTGRTIARRDFIRNAVLAAASVAQARSAAGAAPASAASAAGALRIGIRASSLRMAGKIEAIRVAAGIPGLRGIELQATAGTPNLRDQETIRRYRAEADRCGIEIPSLAGILDRGVKAADPAAAESIRLTIRAARELGSRVLLLAFFRQDAPDMTRKESYGPIVNMLRQVAAAAGDANVVIGLENSLSPADNARLVDQVGHPSVQVYYDAHNMAHYGHGEQAIPGIRLLGRDRICAVHVKNGDKLIEAPGPIDWPAAFSALAAINYDGWYIYETAHTDVADCIEDTRRNNVFLAKHIRTRPG